jgi:riboflavin kinase/FMN adenylyltransferase
VAPEAGLLPPFGVYAVRAEVGGVWRAGVANLGVRPTVAGEMAPPLLETHLFDWQGDLYGRDLEVRLEAFLRPERRFASVAELRAQIVLDAAAARVLLG